MEEGPLSLKRAFREGFAAFQRQPGLAIGGFLIADLLGGLFFAFIGGPMAGGACKLFLKIGRNEEPEIGDVFSCFKDYGKWAGIFWAWFGIQMACILPFYILAFLNMFAIIGPAILNHSTAPPNPILLVRVYAVHFVLIIAMEVVICALLAKWGFAFFEGLEGNGVIEAFHRSSELTKGRWPRLWWMMIVLYLFAGVGSFACYVGVFVTMAISMNIVTAIYLELKRLQPSTEVTQQILPVE